MADAFEQVGATVMPLEVETGWGRSGQQSYSSEPPADLWEVLSTPVSNRRGVARDFASAAAEQPAVGGLWVTDLKKDLHIAIELHDGEAEPVLRDLFIDLVCERLDPSEGELFVFPKDKVPAWAETGEKLI